MTVIVSSPGPGVGARLLEQRDRGTTSPEAGGAAPPLGRPETPPALIGGLSYSALSDFKNCGYRFYVERVLGIAEPEGPAAWGRRGRWRDAGSTPPLRSRAGGSRPARVERPERVAGSGRGESGGGASRAGARRRWRIREGARVGPGLPRLRPSSRARGRQGERRGAVRALRRGTLVRGSIDLLVERTDGSVLVVDYKTDRLQGRDPMQAAERYRVQRDLYALAAAARGSPVETAYVFLEQPDNPVRETFDRSALDQARARIEDLLARLVRGQLRGDPSPPPGALPRLPGARAALQLRDRAMRDDRSPSSHDPGARSSRSLEGG